MWLAQEGIDVQTDDLGRRAIARSVFGALVREHTSQQKLMAERAALRAAEAAEAERKARVSAGVPAMEGRSPYESMMTSEGRVVTPEMEFGGRERPNWLADELDASARRRHEEATEKKRLADQLKEDLQ
jgi:acetylornithine deacetylase/succinyl-diaminopimelate desuccinylase-like protein